ncbi:farnesyl pyrophosphate synthase-like isoform X2 [Thrips palmi]|uniref:Farnesyl pyrophosphate synthase n=1 Tax=Thrips palmi TaxID=161013 RepID=A0A6P8ZX75_THRPL|nr:farnesyl pyrophosphate synthase-like isoform X2 [Thrips palmi]
MLRLFTAAAAATGSRTMTMLAPSAVRREQIETVRRMNDYFPEVVAQMKRLGDACQLVGETTWLEKMLYYTVPGGKMTRAIIAYNGIVLLGGKDTPGIKEKAMNIAWSLEMLQAAIIAADDISDATNTRRGRDAWHTIAGRDAVFDVMLVENCAYCLLGLHCEGEPYVRTLRHYTEIMFQISMGQNQDNHCRDSEGLAKTNEFTMEKYVPICQHKSGGYSFYLPMATALNVSGIFDKAAHDAALDLSKDLGLLYQVQDDYLDIYGVLKKMGKVRSDIRNGKCTWLIIEALNRANDEQRRRLKENYGYDDEKKIANVMEVFAEMKMKEVFLRWEKSMMDAIEKKIHKYSDVVRPELFIHALEAIKYHVNR